MCSEGLRERYVNPYTDFAFKLLWVSGFSWLVSSLLSV